MEWMKNGISGIEDCTPDMFIDNIIESAKKIVDFMKKDKYIVCQTDYDVDGITCSYEFWWMFEQLGYKNYKVYTPNRNLGYGLSKKKIDMFHDADMIITGDNGITAKEPVEYGKSKYGIEFIITDHHSPQEEHIPDCLIVNPKLGSNKFLKDISGATVVWYLMREIFKLTNCKSNELEILDIVTLSTVADMVPLQQANRLIVQNGLKRMNNNRFGSKGLELMMSNVNERITSETLSFQIAPILNSCGRLGDSADAFEFLKHGDLELYEKLIEMNIERKEMQEICTNDAMQNIDATQDILIYSGDYHKGLVGLVSSTLMNKFDKPSIIFDASGHLSGRSPKDINISQIMKANENLLSSWGGHFSAVGGLTKEYDKFKESVEEYCKNNLTDDEKKCKKYYWKQVEMKDFPDIINKLEYLAPFGMGNQKPNIVIKDQIISELKVVGKNSNVLIVEFESGLSGVIFKHIEGENPLIEVGSKIDLLGSVEEDSYSYTRETKYKILIEDMKGSK